MDYWTDKTDADPVKDMLVFFEVISSGLTVGVVEDDKVHIISPFGVNTIERKPMDDKEPDSLHMEDDEARELAESQDKKRQPDRDQGVDVNDPAGGPDGGGGSTGTGTSEGGTPSQGGTSPGGASYGGGSGN